MEYTLATVYLKCYILGIEPIGSQPIPAKGGEYILENKENKTPPEGDTSAGKQKTETPTSGSEGDLTKEQWEVAFKHPRFKDLAEEKKSLETQLKQIREEKEKEEEGKLKEKEKYKELAEKKDEQLQTLQTKFVRKTKEQAIIQEAVKLGISDTEAAIKLADLEKLQLNENGDVINAEEIVKGLVASRPYLVAGKPTGNVGTPTPQGEGEPKLWNLSFLREKMKDAAWYKEHEADIDKAFKEGRVDTTK